MPNQFAIQSLFLTLTIAAFCVQLVLKSDWIAACGFVVSACILISAIQLKRVSNLLRFLLAVTGCALMWFVVVDYSISTDWCYKCNDHRFCGQYRICGIPLNSNYGRFHRQIHGLLRSDLGMPCNHKFEHEVRMRFWGLFYAARPFQQGTCCKVFEPYTEEDSRRVRQFAEDNPEDVPLLMLLRKVDDGGDDGGALRSFMLRIKNPESSPSH